MHDLTLREERQFKRKFQAALDNGVNHVIHHYTLDGRLVDLKDCRFFFTNYLRNDRGNFAQVYLNYSKRSWVGWNDFVKNSSVLLSITGEDELIGLQLMNQDEISNSLGLKFNALLGIRPKETDGYGVLDQERLALGLNFDLLEESGDCNVELWYKK